MKNDFKNLSLDEKLKLLSGKDCWHSEDLDGKVTQLAVADGPHGLRKNRSGADEKGVCFPTLSSLANTWNPDLAYLQGEAIASTCVEKNIDIILAPGVNIKRNVFCGRNFEYFSEDPLLSGILAKSYINGVQSLGIGACIKHFACNNYEYGRLYRSSEVDERTLFEIYLKQFEIALDAKPWSIMPSYNCVNGVYACENTYLLNDILKNKFKYDGYLISDWGAVHNSAKSLKAGIDLRMPNDQNAFKELKEAYDIGFINDEMIDNSLNHLSNIIEKTQNNKKKVKYNREQNHLNALKIAEEGIVLLKNDDNILPIDKDKKLLVCGYASINPPLGGGGSSGVNTDYKLLPLEELLKSQGYKTEFRYGYNEQYVEESSVILQRVASNDYAILTVHVSSNNFTEGTDRATIKLTPAQENLIHQVSSKIKTIVIIYCGGVIDVSSWKDEVSAIILAGYNGEAVNEAVANVISGKVNPSGKLAESFISSDDNKYIDNINSFENVERYSEGVFVGYRRLGMKDYNVIYPFGYGLSYSTFEYSNLNIIKINDLNYEVTFNIRNTSSTDGKEVAQLYISDLSSSVSRPLRELKAFEKVLIKAGETKTIKFLLNKDAFSFYNSNLHDWYVENGLFEVQIGSSCLDIKLKDTIDIELNTYTQYSRER